MSETLTRRRIVAMWAEFTTNNPGVLVRTAYNTIPRALQDADLPGVVVFPGQATFDKSEQLGEQMTLDTRLYEMVLYLQRALFGTEDQGMIDADPYFDSVRAYFQARPGLELDSEGNNQTYAVFNSFPVGDGGFQVGPYPAGEGSPDYLQIRWQLQVQEVSQIVYNYG